MAGTPSFLLVFNESTGNSCADETVNNNDGAISVSAVENTDFAWHPNADPLLSFIEFNHAGNSNSSMPYISHTGWQTVDKTQPQSLCIGFLLNSLPQSQSYLFGNGGGQSTDDGLHISAQQPTSTGDFDLFVQFELNGFGPVQFTVPDLSFGVVYKLSARGAALITGNSHLGYSLDGSATASATGPDASFFNLSAVTYIARSDFATDFGVDGNFYYAAYWRNEFLSDADMESFSSDPTQIPDWPSVGGGVSGTLTGTLGALTASGQGTVPVEGAVDETLSALLLEAAGSVQTFGAFAAVLDQLLLDSTDGTTIEGVLAKTLEGATLESDAVLPIAGTLIETLAQLSLEAEGVPSIEAVASNELEELLLAAQAEMSLVGTANIQLEDLLLAAQAAVGSLEATLDVQLALLTLRAGNRETMFWRNLWISVWEDLNGNN